MKKFLLFKFMSIVLFTLFGVGGLNAQVTLPHYEGFDYSVAAPLQTQAGWVAANSGDDIIVIDGNLMSPSLAFSSGRKITFGSDGIDASKLITSQATGTLYCSFLMNVTSLGSLNAAGGYFTGLAQNATTFGATVWTGLDGSGYKIGINPRTSTPTWVTGTQSLGSTVFVVVSYEFITGTANDVVNIWINPSSSTFGSSSVPTPNATATNTGGTDLTGIDRFFLRQDSSTETPNMEMDEVRIGTTWADVTPAAPAITSVTFNVDMNAVAGFVVGTDLVYLTGSMVGWAEPGTNANYLMTDTDGDKIYTKVLSLNTPVGEIQYKYFKNAGWNGGEWTGDPNRKTTVTESTSLNDVFGNYLNDVAIATAPFFAGDAVTFNWTSAGVSFVKIEVWIPQESRWEQLFASTAADGSEPFTIPLDAEYHIAYKIRVSNVANLNAFDESATFEIIATPTIYDIQSKTLEGGDISHYKGQKVRTRGTVTAIGGSNFWLQMPASEKLSVYPEWAGVFVYHATTAAVLAVGDDVTLIATVDEYLGATELANVSSYVINSQNNFINPVLVSALDAAEAYESTLITLKGAIVQTEADATTKEFTINDGTADYIVDDKMFAYTPTVGDMLNITGIIGFATPSFKIYPRTVADVVVSSLGVAELLSTEIKIYPNPSSGKFSLQLGNAFKTDTKIEVFNAVGMCVLSTKASGIITDLDLNTMKQGVYYVRVDDGKTIFTQKIVIQ